MPHCEARSCSCLHGLQSRAGRVNELRERNATRGQEDLFFLAEFTHSFVCNELVGEQLDWWMAVTLRDQGVFRVRVYELGESRVDKACVRINRLSSVCRW